MLVTPQVLPGAAPQGTEPISNVRYTTSLAGNVKFSRPLSLGYKGAGEILSTAMRRPTTPYAAKLSGGMLAWAGPGPGLGTRKRR